MAKRKRRAFTKEFKAQAVRLVRESGKPVGTVAQDLDLAESMLRHWVRQARIDSGHGPAGALTTDEREEFTRLRREVRTLRMERDILKNFRVRRGPSTCWTRNSARSYADGRPGAVAVCLLVTSRAREKTWSGGGLRT